MEKCIECNKEISDAEWVTNWGSCADCFNKHLDKYYKENPAKLLPIQEI